MVALIKGIVPEYVGDVDSMELKDAHTAQNGNGAPADSADIMTPEEKTA